MSGILIKSGLIGMVKVMYPFFPALRGRHAHPYRSFRRDPEHGSWRCHGSFRPEYQAAVSLEQHQPDGIYRHRVRLVRHPLPSTGHSFIFSITCSLKEVSFSSQESLLFQAKTLRIHNMGGLLRVMPMTGLCFLIASLAIVRSSLPERICQQGDHL